MKGYRGLWRALEGSGVLWRALEGPEGLWRALEGSGGLWKALAGFPKCRNYGHFKRSHIYNYEKPGSNY